MDHNSSPREDISKYGEQMVRDGKLTQRQLDKAKRWQAAHANAIEGYPFFVASVVCCTSYGI
jgi:uncharacterized MAPEG superfamily protein